MIAELKFLKKLSKSILTREENIFFDPIDVSRLGQIDEERSISTQFDPALVPSDLDVIIVGGGIGGLVSASFLSRVGKKVLVLEKNEVAGGCTKVFEFKDHPGYELPIGCHYIAGAVDNTIYKAIFNEASLNSLEFVDLPPYFDKVIFSDEGKEFAVSTREQFQADLIEQFPEETEGIKKFIDLCFTFLDERDQLAVLRIMPDSLKKAGRLFIARNYIKYKDVNFQQYLDDNFGDPFLKGILSYMCIALGVKPDEVPLPIMAVCFAVFLDGTSYPKHGAGAFARKISRANEYYGGRTLCNADVSKILVTDDNKAYGVELSDGTRLEAKTVISACGYIKTFKYLLPNRFEYVVEDFEPGCQHFLVFLGFEAAQDVLQFPEHNIYLAKNVDHFGYKDFRDQETLDDKVELPPMFINFPTVYHSQDGKSIAVIAIEARYDWFKKWKDAKDDEYMATCDALMQRCLHRFFTLFPDAKKHLDFAKWGTPLDMERWIGSPSGSSFTTKLNFDRLLHQTQLTPVENLYMTGADAFLANGITVGAISGLIAAQIVSGKSLISMIMEKEKQAVQSRDC